jgi:hypothetical protein
MFNHTAVAKAVVTAACTLAIALLTIGMGVDPTWAGSDPPSALQSASTLSEVVVPPVPGPSQRSLAIPRPKKLSQVSQPSTGPTTPTPSPSPPCAKQDEDCSSVACCPKLHCVPSGGGANKQQTCAQ